MAEYRLSNDAKEDLIRIHQFGVQKFFDYFEIIAQRPFSFESVDYIKEGYRRCHCGSDTIYYRIHDSMVEIMAIIGM
jgi:toxin ParE1/3/4